MKTVVHWFRRDLRLTDNSALSAAVAAAEEVVPVYVVSDWRGDHRWTGPHRQQFLCESLAALDGNLRAAGGRLVVRRGTAVAELEKLLRESRAEALFFNRDPDPFGRKVEDQVREMAAGLGVEVRDFKDVCLHERDEVLTAAGGPFRVFTPYARAWNRLAKTAPAGKLRRLTTSLPLPSESLPQLADWGLSVQGETLSGGEKAARARLTSFLERGLEAYGEDRDHPGEAGTSRLGQDFRHGLLSMREVFSRIRARAETFPAKGRLSAEKYLGELIWREFYINILWHYPEVLEEEFNPKFRGLKWPGRPADFGRWSAGETGFPLVDAAMRQLNQTGFMHNRARMITAMFLTKDLHLDWRLGEAYFLKNLTDGEIASNNGGWQWSAGTGADAAPYFRIQNPWTQTKRYDPEGVYIKKWLPELRQVAPDKLCRPPDHKLASNYPLPMVDHAEAREKTLKMFADWQKGARS